MKTREELLERIIELQDKVVELEAQLSKKNSKITLVKLGDENWKPTDDEMQEWTKLLESAGAQNCIVCSHPVEIEQIKN